MARRVTTRTPDPSPWCAAVMTDAVRLAWQGSLLATGEASVDRTFVNLQRHELTGGAWRDYVPGWLAGADQVFALLPRHRAVDGRLLVSARDDGPGIRRCCRSLGIDYSTLAR